MVTDITYCDWLCPFENCERNAYQLEDLVKENNKEILQQVSWGKFENCPHYGSTKGMYIPMQEGADDYERAIEQMEHDMIYEQTYNSEDGSM